MLKKLSFPHFLSFLLIASVWVVYNQHGTVNDDGGLYIRQAYFFAQGDFKTAISLFNWPLFGFLIGTLHQLTNIPLLYAAHAIDVACFLIAALFFLKTLSLLTKDKNITLAGFLVIITSLPLIDDYLAMVLRDHGMWAGFMAGVYYFIKWHRTPTLFNALAWQACFFIGALFRPEVLIFNLILPIVTLFNPPKDQSKTQGFIQSITLILIGLGFLAIFGIYQATAGHVLKLNLGRLPELYQRPLALVNQIFTPLPVQSSNMFLKSVIDHYPHVFKFSFLSAVIVYKWVIAMGLLHLAAIYTALKYKLIGKPDLKIIKTLFFIAIIVSTANFFHIFVDTNRYWLTSYWLAYFIAAFGFLYWIKKISGLNKSIKFFYSGLLMLIVLAYVIIGLFDSKPHRPQELEVIDWLKTQHIDLEKVFFNDRRLIIYAQRYEIEDAELSEALQKQPAYIVLRASQLQDIKEIPSAYQQIMQFSLEGKVRFVVYKKQ